MPMLMLKCKTCGQVFPGLYVPEGSTDSYKSANTNTDTLYTCSRGHENKYNSTDYTDLS
jgi:hypothetical protein